MTSPDLQTCLANLARDKHYHVVEMLKSSEFETTELVVYELDAEPVADTVADTAAESNVDFGDGITNQGSQSYTQPGVRYIRKQIANASNAGNAYELLYLAEKQGRKLACAPRVLDCYDIPGYQVVILEYLEGETLDAWVAQHGAGEKTTQFIFPKLCDAVAQLHASFDPSLIHRDIKPSNIMILADGTDDLRNLQVKVIDFGIARLFNEDSDCDTRALGTRAYAPPEQFGYGQTDVRSDVYALGAVLYFMLTGATPHASFSSREKCDVFLSAANPALAAVIRKASAFDPQQRYQTVGELKAAFLHALPASTRESIERETDKQREASNPATTQSPSLSHVASSTPSTEDESGLSARAIIGIVWDVLVFLVLLLFLWGCVISALNPSETQAAIPATNLWIASMGLAIMFVGIALLLFDRAPFTSAFSVLERYTLKRRLIIGLSVGIGGFLIMFISLGLAALA